MTPQSISIFLWEKGRIEKCLKLSCPSVLASHILGIGQMNLQNQKLHTQCES